MPRIPKVVGVRLRVRSDLTVTDYRRFNKGFSKLFGAGRSRRAGYAYGVRSISRLNAVWREKDAIS